ncbi:MAG: hypothetical protein DI537_28705 [Stutzerimonas stutzeri]|nr:MAG: hypothetical protein DI537_28705 [Stutzerimonas stutzeri]
MFVLSTVQIGHVTVLPTQDLLNGITIETATGPFDLTGWDKVEIVVGDAFDRDRTLVILSSDDGTILLDPDLRADGIISLNVPQATVETWQTGTYAFFLRVVGPEVREIVRGTWAVYPGRALPLPGFRVVDVDGPQVPIEIFKTEDIALQWRFVRAGAPFDLTGYALSLQIRPAFGHNVLIGDMAGYIARPADALGGISVRVQQPLVAGYPAGAWVYTLVASKGVPGGATATELARGPFIIRP